MLRKEYASLSQRFERFEKTTLPLQTKVIDCANKSLSAMKGYVASDKSPEKKAHVKDCLDKWRAALDEYEKSKK